METIAENVFTEIASWLIGFSPSLGQIRNLVHLGLTCKRFLSLLQSPEIWRRIDLAKIVNGAAVSRRVQRINHFLRRPDLISSCRRLSVVFGATAAHNIALIRAIPNLTDLDIRVSSEVCRDEVATAPELLGRFIDSPRVISAIESLRSLERLRIIYKDDEPMSSALQFPRTLRRLCLVSSQDVTPLFGKDANPITELSIIGVSDHETIAQASIFGLCPSLTSASIKLPLSFPQECFDALLLSCRGLRTLSIRCPIAEHDRGGPLSAGNLSCCHRLTKIVLDVPVASDTCANIAENCPGVEELFIGVNGNEAAAIRSLASLCKLSKLSLSFHSDHEQSKEVEAAFAALGHAEATPFERLEIQDWKCDLTAFFSSHRCSVLREVTLGAHKPLNGVASVKALAANARNTLRSANIVQSSELAAQLLEGCPNLERFSYDGSYQDDLVSTLKTSIAPLTSVSFQGLSYINPAGVEVMAAALSNTVELTFRDASTSRAAVVKLVSRLPKLRKLHVPLAIANKITSELPETVLVLET